MYDRILVPTDGSPTAAAAMREAIDLAGLTGASVHVLHVIDTWRYDTSIESAVEPLKERGEEYLAELAAAARAADVPVTTAMERGRPAGAILDYVDANEVDLVVIGTRGRGGLARRLLGGVTSYVVTHASVPVHVVPPADGE